MDRLWLPPRWDEAYASVGAQGDHLHYLHWKLMRERRSCPTCEEGSLRRIIYGLVAGGELQEKADRGEVVLGGCQVGENSPDWECPHCGAQFREQHMNPPG